MSWTLTAYRAGDASDGPDADRLWIAECLNPGCYWTLTDADPTTADHLAALHAPRCRYAPEDDE